MNWTEIAETALLIGGGLIFEAWLGVSPRFKANSTLELAYNAVRTVWQMVRRATAGAPREEGEVRMSIEKREIIESESARKLSKFVEELVCDVVDQKDKKEILGDLTETIELLPELRELSADYKADPAAVERSLLLGAHELVRRLVASLKARGDAAHVPGKSPAP